jgi:hypothetical protein
LRVFGVRFIRAMAIAVTSDWAEQLKNAGFPRAAAHDFPARAGADTPSDNPGEAKTYRPSLSELIAACPKEIGTATFVLGSSQGGRRWTATYFDFRNNRMVDDDALCQSADTPEEAVARLWLAGRS